MTWKSWSSCLCLQMLGTQVCANTPSSYACEFLVRPFCEDSLLVSPKQQLVFLPAGRCVLSSLLLKEPSPTPFQPVFTRAPLIHGCPGHRDIGCNKWFWEQWLVSQQYTTWHSWCCGEVALLNSHYLCSRCICAFGSPVSRPACRGFSAS